MDYIFGLLANGRMVIAEQLHDDLAGVGRKLANPAIIEMGMIPYVHPLTNQPDPKRAAIVINCIPLPVKHIFRDAITTVLSYPIDDDEAVTAYKNILTQRQSAQSPSKKNN